MKINPDCYQFMHINDPKQLLVKDHKTTFNSIHASYHKAVQLGNRAIFKNNSRILPEIKKKGLGPIYNPNTSKEFNNSTLGLNKDVTSITSNQTINAPLNNNSNKLLSNNFVTKVPCNQALEASNYIINRKIENFEGLEFINIFLELINIGISADKLTQIILNSRLSNENQALNMLFKDNDNLWHHKFTPMPNKSESDYVCTICSLTKKDLKVIESEFEINEVGLLMKNNKIPKKKSCPKLMEIYINHDISNSTDKGLYTLQRKCEICQDILSEHSIDYNVELFEKVNLIPSSKPYYKINSILNSREVLHNYIKCIICFEKINIFNDSKLRCGHKICKSCLTIYIQYQMYIYFRDEIRCPYPNCISIIPADEMIESTSYNAVQSLMSYNFQRKMLELSKAIYCRKCGEYNELTRTNEGSMSQKCKRCDLGFCNLCKLNEHQNFDCRENLILKFNKYMRGKDIQLCPCCFAKSKVCVKCKKIECLQCCQYFCSFCRNKECNENSPGKCVLIPFGKQNILSKNNDARSQFWKIFLSLLIVLISLIFFPFVSVYVHSNNIISYLSHSQEKKLIKNIYKIKIQNLHHINTENNKNQTSFCSFAFALKKIILIVVFSIIGFIFSPLYEIVFILVCFYILILCFIR